MKRFLPIVFVAQLAGCGGAPESLPEWGAEGSRQDPGASEPPGPVASATAALSSLTLAQALARVDAEHPELAAYRAAVDAARARGEQAGAFPNPELVLRVENAPWHRGSTRDQANYVAGLTLPLALSGRLGAAEDAGMREADIHTQELAARRLELHGEVRGAFATALSLERAASVQSQARGLATRAVELLEARVAAGDAIPAELARVQIEATRARLEHDRVESLRLRALFALASALGDPGLAIQSLAGDLETALELPALETLIQRLEDNPQLRAAAAEVALQAARVELAQAQRIPDVSLDLFYRRLEQTDQHAFDVGLSIPLPLFDRNQGAVRSELAQQLAASATLEATRNELIREVRATHARLALLLQSVRLIREELLGRADTVLASVEARFAAGDASLVEVLPVRRDWTRIQLSYVDALRQVMVAWSDLQTLTGTPNTP
jgi:cobalt-zinc-cadmium efflux system outer membrane protein